ncbi:CIA30 family protein [Shewanella saliphila]|uniref:Exonuclease n=1 Tax=Shewanella saliphila TaxID=2282698 RepID=A0ABQ2Q6T8_9GAMM|nr:CIA30 family protein [Shewanella saliphila]MCL1102409.1 CIA30 family protein [Shewanella saliphila]GGP55008.1 exonuclease [Shewanella saliphila]
MKQQKITTSIYTTASVLLLMCNPVLSASEAKMLLHFIDLHHFPQWNINNDTVMGGVSQSHITQHPQQALLFSGTVSLANNGGFASTESRIIKEIPAASAITVTLKGDGKTYQLRLKTPALSYGEAYVANFTTQADTITQHRFTASDFSVSFRGRKVANAPALAFVDIDRMGFLVAQKQQGPFAIELHSVEFER